MEISHLLNILRLCLQQSQHRPLYERVQSNASPRRPTLEFRGGRQRSSRPRGKGVIPLIAAVQEGLTRIIGVLFFYARADRFYARADRRTPRVRLQVDRFYGSLQQQTDGKLKLLARAEPSRRCGLLPTLHHPPHGVQQRPLRGGRLPDRRQREGSVLRRRSQDVSLPRAFRTGPLATVKLPASVRAEINATASSGDSALNIYFREKTGTSPRWLGRDWLWCAQTASSSVKGPWHRASQAGHPTVVDALSAHGRCGPGGPRAVVGEMPLLLAAINGRLDVVRVLLRADVDPVRPIGKDCSWNLA